MMPAGKVRVYRAHNHGPRLAQALVLGMILGVVTKLVDPIVALNFPTIRSVIPAKFILYCLLPLLCLATFQRHCRHRAWSFLIGAVVAVSFVLVNMAFPMPGYFTDWGSTTMEVWLGIGKVIFLGGGIGGVLNLGLNYVKDALWGRALVQDGSMCPTCAYCVSHLPAQRCPECGATFQTAQLNPSAAPLLTQWTRFGAQVLALLLVTCLLAAVYPHLLFRVAVSRWIEGLPCGPSWTEFETPIAQYLSLRPQYSRELLMASLHSTNRNERATALGYLRWLFHPDYGGLAPDREVIQAIQSIALSDPRIGVRRVAVSTLPFIAEDALYEIMEQILLQEDPMLRWSALASIASGGMTPNPRGTRFFIRGLTDPDPTVRGYVYQRLVANTGQSFPYDPSGSIESRLEAQAVWQAWWEGQQNRP